MRRGTRIWCTHLVLFILSIVALGQTQTESDPAKRQLKLSRRHEIPAAALPCTVEEAAWWEKLRAAGKAVTETGGGKNEKQEFLELLQQGQEHSYRAPIPDGNFIPLSIVVPKYDDDARRHRISGIVLLRVEFRADGFVGEVDVLRSLDRRLDENAADAARKGIFLPAVKDRAFVSVRKEVEMSFRVY